MTSELAVRMRQLREAKTSGRAEFCRLVGFPKKTLENIEQTGRAPKGELLSAICKQWPEHALWLMTGMTDEQGGQNKP